MKRRHVIEMIAVVVLMAGSVAMAGESVDVTHRSEGGSATLRADSNTGPDGVQIDVRDSYVVRKAPPPMREKNGQNSQKMRRKPSPINVFHEVCSGGELSGLLATVFGYAHVSAVCRDAIRD